MVESLRSFILFDRVDLQFFISDISSGRYEMSIV